MPDTKEERNAMRSSPARTAIGALLTLQAAIASAETLPLPANLIALDSRDGEAMLIGAESRADFLPLSMHFVTQATPSYCGVATLVMLLNAFALPAPASPLTAGMGMFDQSNVFTERTETVKARASVDRNGMTLSEFAGLLRSYDLKTDVRHAGESSIEDFRKQAIAALDAEDQYVVVNYLRSALGQKTYGHISPIAAYDADTDRFLILDVTRYKYPPIWVTAADLYAAMNTTDDDAGGKTRGFVLVGR
jgi:hypothetical protein